MTRRTQREPSDRPARDYARTRLDVSYLLEAGAGTGKTSVLVDRVTEIVKSNVTLDRIAVITFTEKAAGELKARIRQRLEKEIAGIPPQHRWSRALKASLASLDRAMITTIHSFAAALLKERPVEADVDPRFSVADELTTTMLLEETWARWIEQEMAEGSEPVASALRLGITTGQLRALAFALAENRDVAPVAAPREEPGLSAAREAILAAAAPLARLAADCVDTADAGLKSLRELEARLPALAAADGARLLALLDALPLRPRDGSRAHWDPPESLAEVKRIIGDLRTRRDEATARSRTLFAHRVASWIAGGFLHQYRAAKESRRLLDFDDLLVMCRDMLRDSAAARSAFQRRFECLLVDEFQDTDPLQAEILFLIASSVPGEKDWRRLRPEPGKLFVVGDPKQSIYRFRRADIEVYEEVRGLMPSGADEEAGLRRLTQNFRTVPSIVAWVNDLFSHAIGVGDEDGYQPRYEAIEAFRAEPPHDGSPRPAGSQVVLLAPPDAEALADEPVEAVRRAEARHVAALLKCVVRAPWHREVEDGGRRPLRYADIALLFRSGTALETYEEVLREQGIPYRIAGGKRYYLRAEMRALQAVLEAIESPHDPLAVVSALRCPVFGCSDEDLVTFTTAGGDWVTTREGAGRGTVFERAFDLLARLHAARNTRSVARTIEDLFEATGALSLFYLKPDGDQRAANLIKAIDLARAHESIDGGTFGSFVRWLGGMAAAERDEGEAPLAEEAEAADAEIDSDCVRISTVHKAKGLEFPFVVLCDASGRGRSGAPACIVERGGPEPRLEFSLGPRDGGFPSAGYAQASEREKRRLQAESARLLYVAATRARDYLVVPVFSGRKPEGIVGILDRHGFLPGPRSRGGGALHRGAIVLDGGDLDTGVSEARPFRIAASEAQPADPAIALQKEGWRRALKVALDRPVMGRAFRSASGLEGRPRREGEGAAGGRGSDARASRALGTAVHAVLERIDLSTGRDVALLAEEEAADAGCPSRAVEVRGLVEKALGSRIVKEALAAPRVFREMAFVAAGETYLTEGRVDLAFESGGALTVVDFKTDDVGGEAEVAARVALYEPQALVYARALGQTTGLRVARVVLLFVRPGIERVIRMDEESLERGKRLLESGQADPSP